MAGKAWKHEERQVARMLGGKRHPANSGGRVDVTSDNYLVQVKNVARLSLAQLEALAVEMEQLGQREGKVGLVTVKRRAGRGTPTPRLVVMTEGVWVALNQPEERG